MTFQWVGEEELANLSKVIESGQLWRGTHGCDFVARLEDAVAQRWGRRYVHAVNSGTSANEAAVAGLGLEPGDEVICPATTPIFVSLPVFAAGGIPVFADVDPRTLIISPDGIKSCLSERTKAVVVVHLFGQPAPMDDLLRVARAHRLRVIEDCAQAFDSYYQGKKVGTSGDVTCFSLQQSKHITSGEGGLIATDDPEIYQRAVLYSTVGMAWYRYEMEPPQPETIGEVPTRGHFAFGHNHRMSELQAAVALTQLSKMERFNAARERLVEIIEEELRDGPGLLLAHRYPDTQPNYWAYPVQLDPTQTSLTSLEVHRRCMAEEGVGPTCYHEVNYLEHVFQEAERKRQTPFGLTLPQRVCYRLGLCPQAEAAAQRTLSFLVHHGRDPQSVRQQAQALRKVMERQRR